jgi:hypothetical protein
VYCPCFREGYIDIAGSFYKILLLSARQSHLAGRRLHYIEHRKGISAPEIRRTPRIFRICSPARWFTPDIRGTLRTSSAEIPLADSEVRQSEKDKTLKAIIPVDINMSLCHKSAWISS